MSTSSILLGVIGFLVASLYFRLLTRTSRGATPKPDARSAQSIAFAQRKAQRAHHDWLESSAALTTRGNVNRSEYVAHESIIDARIAATIAKERATATLGHRLYKSTAAALVNHAASESRTVH